MSRLTSLARESGRALIPLAILAAGIGGFLAFGQKPEEPSRQSTDDRYALVRTDQVTPFDGPIVIDVDGVAEPFQRITLAAEVDGRITKKSPQCRGGHFVDQDTELLEIDPTDYQLEVQRLATQLQHADEELASVQVDIANTRSMITLAEENLQLWQRELARNQKLSTTSAVTESALDEVRRQELAGRNSLQTQKNQLASLNAKESMLQAAREMINVQLAQARAVLARTRIASPIVGTVVTAHVEAGDYVRQGDPLVEISAARPMEVRCNLRVDQLYWILLARGQDAQVTAAGDPSAGPSGAAWEIPRLPVEVVYNFGGAELVWQGNLSRYEGSGIDPQTRTVPCRVLVQDPLDVSVRNAAAGQSLPPARLFSGMYVQIHIPVDPPVPLLALPQAAVRPGGQVWIVRDGKLQIETIDVARVDRDRVLIRGEAAPVRPGDEVVISPLAAVQNGMPVRVQEAAPP